MEELASSSGTWAISTAINDSYKNLSNTECPSTCVVCRNSASGYHYDVPSCNGCKTFFRRTILVGRKFVCSKNRTCFDGAHPIDTTKRMCRACRFTKCVESGMNAMSIQAQIKTKEGKELRKQLIDQMNNNQIVTRKLTFNEENIDRIIGNLSLVESKIEPLHSSGIPPGYWDVRNLDDILTSTPIFSVQEIPNMLYLPQRFHKTSREPKPWKVNYLHSSFLAILEFAKTFHFYNEINFEDKKLLLKHATVMCSNILSAFFSIDRMNSDKLLHPDGSIAGPPPRKNGDLFVSHRATLQKTLISLLENKINRVEYLLLKAIVLCNPAVPGLSLESQYSLDKERRMYMNCLLRYSFQQYGLVNGPSRFSALLATFSVFENQQ